jgi:CopG family nickel-responsive transcriptional regulator
MKSELVRFGIAMEPGLLEQLDQLAEARGCTRSELLRDLARAEVSRANARERVPAVAAVTLVYNHHVRELSERLTSIQHDLGDQVRSTMHVHLDHDNCLEVIVLRGRSDELRAAAERMLGTRGVSHGGVELVTESALAPAHGQRHQHGHGHPHDHSHARTAPLKNTGKARRTRSPVPRRDARPKAGAQTERARKARRK